jgi:hypothetical protein
VSGDKNDVRFWSKVDVDPDGCWRWRGATTPSGAGLFHVAGRTLQAHRYAFDRYHAPVSRREVVLHLCQAASCVRPEHLYIAPVTANIEPSLRLQAAHRAVVAAGVGQTHSVK